LDLQPVPLVFLSPLVEEMVSFLVSPLTGGTVHDPGAPKAIIFDAAFDRAKIEMVTEELTMEGATAALEEAMTSEGLLP